MTDQPDNFEKGIRFGCGTLFGLVLGFLGFFQFAGDETTMTFGLIVAFALVLGLLAVKHGDRFWHSFKSWWFWFWPW